MPIPFATPSVPPSPPFDPLLSLKQILGNADRPGLIAISRSTFYELIQSGAIPRPVKIGTRSLWRLSEIQQAIDRLSGPHAGVS